MVDLWANIYSYNNIKCINNELGHGGWGHTFGELNRWLNDKRNQIESGTESWDGLLFFFSGHGDQNKLTCADGVDLEIEDIVRKFNKNNVTVLEGLPKIMYIDACRGGARLNPNTGVIWTLNRNKGGPSIHKMMRYPNIKSDVMIHYATTKENVARTIPNENVSFFVKEIIRAMKTWTPEKKTLSFISLHINHCLNVSSHGEQTAEVVSNLTYEIIIKPRNC